MSNRTFLMCFFVFRVLLSFHTGCKHLLSRQYVTRDLPEVLDLIDRLEEAIKSAKSTIENCALFDQAIVRHDCESQNSLTRLMVLDWESKTNQAQAEFRQIEEALAELLENTWHSFFATLHLSVILWGVISRKVFILQYALLSPIFSFVLKDVEHGNIALQDKFFMDFLRRALWNLPLIEHFELEPLALGIGQHFIENGDPIWPQSMFWGLMIYVYHLIMLESKVILSRSQASKPDEVIMFRPSIKIAHNDPILFFHSCLYNLRSQMKYLIQSRDFNINIQEERSGNTAMHLAVLIESVPLVQILLGNKQHKVDLLLKNNDGMTALQLALSAKNHLLAHLIMRSNHFKLNLIKDMDSLVLTTVQAEKWQLALNFVQKRRDYPFRCQFLQAMLERCCCLNKELDLLTKGPQSVKLRKIQNMRIYKTEIIRSLDKHASTGTDVEKRRPEQIPKQLEVVKDIFECYVCFNPMFQVQIFACSNDHWMCVNCCSSPSIRECPMCKECFRAHPPKRCITAEKIALTISSQ